MKSRTILKLTLAFLLAVGIAVQAPAVSANPDTESTLDAQTPPPPPPEAGAPDADTEAPPAWTCPKCGADCPNLGGRHGRGHKGRRAGMRAPRAGRGHGDGHFGRGPQGAGLPSQGLLKRAQSLDLSAEQIDQLEKLTYDAKAKMIDLDSDLEKARLDMQRLMQSDSDDLAAMKKQLESVSKKRLSIQELKLKNWIDTKGVLTDEQKELVGQHHQRMGLRL